MSKVAEVDSSLSERPEHQRPRRLADWMNPTGERKVHSLIDKVYKRKNLEMAWERVKANRGAGGVDGQSINDFAGVLDEQLDRLQEELRNDAYRPHPVRRKRIPKAGKPGKHRELGIPTVYDRVCQQALLNRLEPIFGLYFTSHMSGSVGGGRLVTFRRRVAPLSRLTRMAMATWVDNRVVAALCCSCPSGIWG